MIDVSDRERRAIESVIRDSFPGKVEGVDIEMAMDEEGEEVLLIRIAMTKDTTDNDFSGRFFGLTGRVRDALGEDRRGVFPVIRPV